MLFFLLYRWKSFFKLAFIFSSSISLSVYKSFFSLFLCKANIACKWGFASSICTTAYTHLASFPISSLTFSKSYLKYSLQSVSVRKNVKSSLNLFSISPSAILEFTSIISLLFFVIIVFANWFFNISSFLSRTIFLLLRF